MAKVRDVVGLYMSPPGRAIVLCLAVSSAPAPSSANATPAIAPARSRKFLDEIEAAVPDDLDVHFVMDNYATHKDAADPQLAGEKAALARI